MTLGQQLRQAVPSFEQMMADPVANAGAIYNTIPGPLRGTEKFISPSVPGGQTMNLGLKDFAAASGEALSGAKEVIENRCAFIQNVLGTACDRVVKQVETLIDRMADSIGGGSGAAMNTIANMGSYAELTQKAGSNGLNAQSVLDTGKRIIDDSAAIATQGSQLSWGDAVKAAIAYVLRLVIKPIIMQLVRGLCAMFSMAIMAMLQCDDPSGPPVEPSNAGQQSGGSPGIPSNPAPGAPGAVGSPRSPVVRIGASGGAATLSTWAANNPVIRNQLVVQRSEIVNAALAESAKRSNIQKEPETPWGTYALWGALGLGVLWLLSGRRASR